MRRLSLAFALVSMSMFLAACGGGDDGDDHADSTSTPAAVSPNDADVMFTQGMIPHHEQAIEMAEIALRPAVDASAAVTDLATRIRDAQDPEIQKMRGWLEAWGESEVHMGDHGGTDGMMSPDEMAELEHLTGAAFDRAWMEMMIRHHQGAISMAETAKTGGNLDDVKALADAIITAQQAEIDEMQTLLQAT